jgi:hypothetical protein
MSDSLKEKISETLGEANKTAVKASQVLKFLRKGSRHDVRRMMKLQQIRACQLPIDGEGAACQGYWQRPRGGE